MLQTANIFKGTHNSHCSSQHLIQSRYFDVVLNCKNVKKKKKNGYINIFISEYFRRQNNLNQRI